MAEQGKGDVFEFYSKATKTWMDSFAPWSKMTEGIPQNFRGADVANFLKPFWDYAEDWGKVYGNMSNMMKTVPFPYAATKDANETAAKSMNTYTKVTEAWFKAVNAFSREEFEIGRKMAAGETVETGKLMEVMSQSSEDVSKAMAESLQSISFDGTHEVGEAFKESTEMFSDDKKQANHMMEAVINFNIKTMGLLSDAARQSAQMMTDMKDKDSISTDGFSVILDTFGDNLKRLGEALQMGPSSACNEITDSATNFSKANLELSVAWMETNAKFFQGFTKSFADAYRTSEEVFKEGKVTSADDFYKKWTEASKKAGDVVMEDLKTDQSSSRLVRAYAGWAKAAEELSRTAMTSPYPTKDELERVSDELDRVKRALEKERKARAKADEVKVEG